MRSGPRIFLLSPAYCGGRRAAILLKPTSAVPLAQRLRAGTLTLGEAFSFMSGLYFRGKLTYASAFGRSDTAGDPAVYIITPTRGLQRADLPVTIDLIREFATVDVSSDDRRYRAPLERDLTLLARRLPADARVVLLGSVATGKYVDILAAALGSQLYFPTSFIGRGDMSRGGLLLRCAAAGAELDYAALDATSPRRGPRPAKLEPIKKASP